MQVTSKVTGWIARQRHMPKDERVSNGNRVPTNILLDDLSIEGNAHGTKEEASVLVRLGGGVEGNVATRDHLGRIPITESVTEG